MQPAFNPYETSRLSWRRVALVTVLLGVIALGAVFLPSARQALEEREARQLSEFYSTGLSPCDSDLMEVDALIKTYIPGEPSTSITAFPSFSKPEAVRVVDNRLYHLVLDSPYGKRPLNPPHVDASSLSGKSVRALSALISGDIRYANAKLPPGLDGTTYIFTSRDRGCAMAWSPDSATRAGKLVALFYRLVEHSKIRNPTVAKNSDKELLTAIRSLERP